MVRLLSDAGMTSLRIPHAENGPRAL
jgi:hypothetical protein